jgi:hypothetical protein
MPSTEALPRCNEHDAQWIRSIKVPNGLYHYYAKAGGGRATHEIILPAEVKVEDGKVIDVTPKGCSHGEQKYDEHGALWCINCGSQLEEAAPITEPAQAPLSV